MRAVKSLLFFLGFSLSFTAHALTSGQFVGRYGIIRVVARDASGATDTDGQVLLNAMNVPTQNSMLGPGKVIESSDRALQFICADRPQVGAECSIFIQQNGHGIVDMFRKYMQYKVIGSEADVYAKLFKMDGSGEFHFTSIEGSLKVEVRPQYFEVYFKPAPAATIARESLLVIANVEDTLKISHVQNFWDSLNYDTNNKKRYLGMSEALNILAAANPSARFVYLTRGTELVSGKIEREFLVNFKFPRGEFKDFNKGPYSTTRLADLRKVIQLSGAKKVIVLTHNGASDPAIFNTLAGEFKDIDFNQYIHLVYSTSSSTEVGTDLFTNQTGYVTSVELLVDWQQKGFTGLTETVKFASSMVGKVITENPEVSQEDEVAIPTFVNCDDFQWRWPVDGDFKVLAPLREHLGHRCHFFENEN